MMVRGERFVYPSLSHDDKRDAIGNRPFLVGAFSVQLAPLMKKRGARRHDLHIRLLPQQRKQTCEAGPILRLAESVSDFR